MRITSFSPGKTSLMAFFTSSTEETATPFGTLIPCLPINSAPYHKINPNTLDIAIQIYHFPIITSMPQKRQKNKPSPSSIEGVGRLIEYDETSKKQKQKQKEE